MMSSAEAAAYLRWTEGDESSLRFVSPKTARIGNVVRYLAPTRFKKIAQTRNSLSNAIAAELNNHNADTVLDFGAGYSTLGTRWIENHPQKQYIEVDEETIITRKRALLPPRNSVILLAGNIANATLFSLLHKKMKGGNIVALLEGVISYLREDELDVCVEGIESLFRTGDGVLITHQTTATKEGRTLRSLLWGKRTDIDIVAVLRRRGWRVTTKHSFGWNLVVASFPSTSKNIGSPSSDSVVQAKEFYRSLGARGLAVRTNEKKTALTIKDLRKLFSKEQKLLDVGCGYGRITVPLALQGYRVSGVDITPELIRAAKQYARKENTSVMFKLGDMRTLPYPAASFDGLFCLWSAFSELLTKRDQLSAIKSMRQVLTPGGLAVIDLPDMRHPHPIFTIQRTTNIVHDTTTGHISYLHDAATLDALMKRARIAKYKISIRNFWGRKRLVLLFWA